MEGLRRRLGFGRRQHSASMDSSALHPRRFPHSSADNAERNGSVTEKHDDSETESKERRHARSDKAWKRRFKPQLSFVVLAIFFVNQIPVQLPSWMMQGLILAVLGLLAHKVYTFQRWNDEKPHVLRFLACFTIMIVELSWENGMVWLCSATDLNKYKRSPPLQDNAEIAMHMLGEQSALIHWLNRFRWVDIKQFLGALLALAFSVLWGQIPYSGFGLFARALGTLTYARLIRVAAFMLTILPNPKPGCYMRRFPPLPPTTWEIIKAGYTSLRGFGGCNDLVISGHGTFWALAPLAFQTYYPRYKWVSVFLWVALVHTSLRDVYDKQHYSVDMFLAAVVTALAWHHLEWIYPASEPVPPRAPGSPPEKPPLPVMALIAVALIAAAIIVIGGKC